MFNKFFIIFIIISFGAFLYGAYNIFIAVEENACRMTYMFGIPQFSKVTFEDNKLFPNYGLYYYYEGSMERNVNILLLKGAPVIFVPGNAGSYKQVRSLASVALKKSIDNEHGIHIDYFTIDYDEQLSGLYGAYLENQKQFLRLCILAVQNLYKNSSNIRKYIILIGHSMGGKVVESVLEELDIARHVNSIISISTPLGNPVINFDSKINQFYMNSEYHIYTKRTCYELNSDTNVCRNFNHRILQNGNESKLLENVLMISIGGGNRDLLVRDGLTASKFSDIHAMTSSIPKVWLSCDHLSAVWCLQLMKVMNRFIFGISNVDKHKNVFFIEDKLQRTQIAINYFVKPLQKHELNEISFPNSTIHSKWQEELKIANRIIFKNGLPSGYNLMLPFSKYKDYEKIFVEVDSIDGTNDWVFGCTAFTFGKTVTCDKGISLAHNAQNVPSHDYIRSIVFIDLQHTYKLYPQWTHILARLQPTNKPITFKFDVYKEKERTFNIRAPLWYSFHKQILSNETAFGSIHYEIFIEALDESFTTLEFNIEPVGCKSRNFNVVAKICVPWARGFERYNHITQLSKARNVYVSVPISPPQHYNTSKNPVVLKLFFDPVCRYRISYKFSFAGTMSKIVQELHHWIPAHLTLVFFIVLKNQINKFQNGKRGFFIKPYAGYFQCKSLYIITGCRVIKKVLVSLKYLPAVDKTVYPFYVSVIIHSTAIVTSIILVFIVWAILKLHANMVLKFALRISRMSETSWNILRTIISVAPLTFGFLFVSIAYGMCSGIALILATIFYCVLVSNAYKDYLENLALEKAAGRFRKLHTPKKCHQLNSDNNTVVTTDFSSPQEGKGEACTDYFEGIENFSFHIAMLLLLAMMSVLNVGSSIAWIKSQNSKYIEKKLDDPCLLPTISVISCLSIILQLDAPHKSSGYRAIGVALYLCACLCIIYCLENIYILNYLISFIYAIVALQESARRLLHCVGKQY